MTTIKKLRKMRELLTPAGAWLQGRYAQTEDGFACQVHDRNAVCWCLVGASLTLDSTAGAEYAIRDFLNLVPSGNNLIFWNDTPGRTQDDVLAAIDGTIAGLEG